MNYGDLGLHGCFHLHQPLALSKSAAAESITSTYSTATIAADALCASGSLAPADSVVPLAATRVIVLIRVRGRMVSIGCFLCAFKWFLSEIPRMSG